MLVRYVAALVAMALFLAEPALAQHRHGGLQAADYDALTRVLPHPTASKSGDVSAVFDVTYEGFTAESEAAFEYALSVWATHISSPVPIRIRARWQSLATNTLGSAGPTVIVSVPGAEANTWYPPSLAGAITGQQVSNVDYDIVANFNSDRTDWYFGIDGETPIGQFDFVTVVMHEIGHGVGMFDSFRIEGEDVSGEGACANASDGEACWGHTTGGIIQQRFPVIYDRFVIEEWGNLLINTNEYPIPSIALAGALTGGSLFFDSETVIEVHSEPALLFAPANYQPASSIAHLDETHYPAGDPNSLMTPSLARAESIHSPGPIFCAMLSDMGWPLGDGCVFLIENPDLGTGGDEGNGNDGDGSGDDGTGSGEDGAGNGAGDDGNGGDDGTGDGNDGEGDENGDGDDDGGDGDESGQDGGTATSSDPPTNVRVTLAADGPYPNPTSSTASIVVSSGSSERVTLALIDMMGREAASPREVQLSPDASATIDLPTDSLAPGIYVVRITGRSMTVHRTLVVVR